MPRIGYVLSCEEHGPKALIENARRAEEVGFDFVLISDHFHPWIARQGNSAFVWSVIGGIARETKSITVGTGVTCPTIRVHPAIIAHAAATCAVMLDGRFFLGVGSGENLNEHILGGRWPSVQQRHEMLEEAIGVMRMLWHGGQQSHYGRHYTVENARIFTLPGEAPPIYMACHGAKATALAGRVADGFIGVTATRESIALFEDAGGRGKPKIAETKVCFAGDEAQARATAREWWPNIALHGQLGQDLALSSHYEAAVRGVTESDVARRVPCGPDPATHVELIQSYVDAGYDHISIHQIGPDQDAFLRFCERHLLPALRG